jgi:hypothetical protein
MDSNVLPIALSVADAVSASGVGRSRLYEALAAGDLPARKLGVAP